MLRISINAPHLDAAIAGVLVSGLLQAGHY